MKRNVVSDADDESPSHFLVDGMSPRKQAFDSRQQRSRWHKYVMELVLCNCLELCFSISRHRLSPLTTVTWGEE
jgi:hypothetical protein